MHLVWLFFLIFLGQNGHYIAEETAKKVQGASEILVVEGEDRSSTSKSTATPTELDLQRARQTPQQRFSIFENDQSSDQNHVESQRAIPMEMQNMLATSKSKSAVLPNMWWLVGDGDRPKLSTPGKKSRCILELATMESTKFIEQIYKKFIGKAAYKRQREEQGATEGAAGFPFCSPSSSTTGAYTIPSTDISVYSKHDARNADDAVRTIKCRPDWSSAQSIPRGRQHADGTEGAHRTARKPNESSNHSRFTQGDGISRACTEELERARRIERQTSPTMDGSFDRVTGQLEKTDDLFRRATGAVWYPNCAGKSKCRQCACNHTESERQSSGKGNAGIGADHPQAGRHDCHPRPGGDQPQSKATWHTSRVCNEARRQAQRYRSDPGAVGYRRGSLKETSKETQIGIAWKRAKWWWLAISAYGYIWSGGSCGTEWYSGNSQCPTEWRPVTTGSVCLCPRNIKREPKKSKRVKFTDAKAYALDSDECAACISETPYDCLFNVINLISTQHSVTQEEDYIDPFKAWTNAQLLRGEVRESGQRKCKTGVKTSRPDDNSQLDIDDDIPFQMITRDGYRLEGRTLPPPNWRQSPWLQTRAFRDALYRNAQGHLMIRIRTWFVSHANTIDDQPRDFSIQAQLLLHLIDRVREVWADCIRADDWFNLHKIQPTPTRSNDDDQIRAHIIVEHNKPDHTDAQAILIAAWEITRDGVRQDQAQWMPMLTNPQFRPQDAHRALELRCGEHQVLVPSGRHDRRWLFLHQHRMVRSGLFLPIWWDRRLRVQPPAEAEDANFLQLQIKSAKESRGHGSEDEHKDGLCDIEGDQRDQAEYEECSQDLRCDLSLQGNEEEFINYMMEVMHPVETQWTVEVHGLSMYHLGTKYTEVETFDVAKIEAAAKRIWSEIQLPSRIFYVWPLPEGQPKIVAILEFHNPVRQRIMEGAVVLRRVFHYYVDEIDVQAAYHQINDRALDLLEQADLRRECEPWGIHKCIIRVNGNYLRPDESPRLRSGSLIDLWIREPIMQSEQIEGVSLMQRAAITMNARLVEVNEGEEEEIVHTFHMSTHYRLISIDTTPELEIIPRVNRAWNFPGDGPIISIYGVSEPPEDLATTASATWILEFANDAERKAMTDDKLVLVDVQLRAPNQPGQSETIRKVMWIRAWMTRTDILHALSAQDYCADAYSYCTVSKNNVIWPDQDTARREMAHGDYVKLAIEGQESLTIQDLLNILHSQEQADSMRYLYQDSPEQAPPRTTGRRSTTRSRSRNRNSDGGSEAEDNREAIEPHVLDRWCAHGRSVEQSPTERKTISISNLEGFRLQEMDMM